MNITLKIPNLKISTDKFKEIAANIGYAAIGAAYTYCMSRKPITERELRGMTAREMKSRVRTNPLFRRRVDAMAPTKFIETSHSSLLETPEALWTTEQYWLAQAPVKRVTGVIS